MHKLNLIDEYERLRELAQAEAEKAASYRYRLHTRHATCIRIAWDGVSFQWYATVRLHRDKGSRDMNVSLAIKDSEMMALYQDCAISDDTYIDNKHLRARVLSCHILEK